MLLSVRFPWAVSLITTLCITPSAYALPPAPPPPAPPLVDIQATASLPSVAESQVKSILFNPYGEADGLRLMNDVIARFPPHRSQALLATVHPGQRVRILGHIEHSAQGELPSVVIADAIINLSDGNIVVDQPPVNNLPLLPPHLRAQTLQPLQVEGKVELLLIGPRAEVNGVILDNQSIVHFPPDSLSSPLRPGMHIVATGLGSHTASGLSMEATQIGSNLATIQPLYAPATPACQPSIASQC